MEKNVLIVSFNPKERKSPIEDVVEYIIMRARILYSRINQNAFYFLALCFCPAISKPISSGLDGHGGGGRRGGGVISGVQVSRWGFFPIFRVPNLSNHSQATPVRY